MTREHILRYHVYVENINSRKIEKYNVLTTSLVEEIEGRTKGIKDKALFAEEVKSVLRYYFWSRSEWEIILTNWPTYMKPEELVRLNEEVEKYQKDFGRLPYRLTVNLETEEKIDVYDQLMLNWDIFINYLWENLR